MYAKPQRVLRRWGAQPPHHASPVNVIRRFLGDIEAEPGVAQADIADRGILLEYRLPHHGYARLALSKGGRVGFFLHAEGAGRPMTSVRFELKEIVLAHVLRKFLLMGENRNNDVHALVVALFTCSKYRAVQNCADVVRLHNEVVHALRLNLNQNLPGPRNTCTARPMPSFRRLLGRESDLIWQDNYVVSERWSLTPDVDAAAARAESALAAWATGATEGGGGDPCAGPLPWVDGAPHPHSVESAFF